MRIALLTCAVFPSEQEAKEKMWVFMRSCQRAGVDPLLYGVGKTFPGYILMKLDYQLEYLRSIEREYDYVVYSDGWDCMLTSSWDELVSKYEAMGKPPILTSAADHLANVSDEEVQYPGCFDHSKLYTYPHVGGYVAEVPAMIDAFSRMDHRTGDDCHSWFDAWRDGWFKPTLDSECQIFQVGDKNTEVVDGRLRNTVTGSNPCILGLHGGYTDQVTGKDAAMIPWAKRLGVIE